MSTPDISFKPLWKLLIDRDISRQELQQRAVENGEDRVRFT